MTMQPGSAGDSSLVTDGDTVALLLSGLIRHDSSVRAAMVNEVSPSESQPNCRRWG